MKRLKLLGLAVIAVLASAMALSATAFGVSEPENLPLASTGFAFTGAAVGEPELKAELNIKCKTAPTEGTETKGVAGEAPSGSYHIKFTGCKVAGLTKCNSKGDASEIILILGTYKLVFDEISPELLSAILFNIEPAVTIECGTNKIEVSGSVLCLEPEATTKKLTHEFTCKANGEKATETEWLSKDPSGAKEKVQLLCNLNAKGAKECAEEAKGTVTTKNELFADL